MSSLISLELVAGLAVVLIACAVAYGIVSRKAREKNAVSRRNHLKERAREL